MRYENIILISFVVELLLLVLPFSSGVVVCVVNVDQTCCDFDFRVAAVEISYILNHHSSIYSFHLLLLVKQNMTKV